MALFASTAMKAPTSKPSSMGAGPSSGSRRPPAGCACCYTCAHWSRPSAVPLGSSMCEIWAIPGLWVLASRNCPLNKCLKALSSNWRFVKSWHPPAGLRVSEKAFRKRKKYKTPDKLFNSEIRKETTRLSQKNWLFQPSWSWVIIYISYVSLTLKTGKAIGLVFSFRMSLPKQFGARHLTGMKTYLVWPLIFILGKENMPNFWLLGPCQSAGPLHTVACRALSTAPRYLQGTGGSTSFSLHPVRLPPGSQMLWGWESQTSHSAITLPRGPLILSRFSIFGIMWKSTICHHQPAWSSMLSLPDPSYCNNYDSLFVVLFTWF